MTENEAITILCKMLVEKNNDKLLKKFEEHINYNVVPADISEKVINNEWEMYELRGKDYYGVTFGSYQYNDIINDFQSTGYIKMLMQMDIYR